MTSEKFFKAPTYITSAKFYLDFISWVLPMAGLLVRDKIKLGFLRSSAVKTPLAMKETLVEFLGAEDPLEKEMATHSSILAWEIPQTEKPGGLQSMGSQKSWTWLSDLTTTAKLSYVDKCHLRCKYWDEK